MSMTFEEGLKIFQGRPEHLGMKVLSRLVLKLYRLRFLTREDFRQMCLIALDQACRCHDPAKGRITTIFVWKLRGMLGRTYSAYRKQQLTKEAIVNVRRLQRKHHMRKTKIYHVDRDRLLSYVNQLPRRMRHIIYYKYMADHKKIVTPDEFARRLKISKTRFWQLHENAVRRLRIMMQERGDDGMFSFLGD